MHASEDTPLPRTDITSTQLPPAKNQLDEYTWEELASISKAIGACESVDEAHAIAIEYGIVDSSCSRANQSGKDVTLEDGTVGTVLVMGIWLDETESGERTGITFCFDQCLSSRKMNSSNDNTGGWEHCSMRQWMNDELLDQLPTELASHIVPVRKKTPNVNETENFTSFCETIDLLWLPSFDELANPTSPYALLATSAIDANGPNEQLEKRDAKSGIPCAWWCRTPAMTHIDGFCSITPDGHVMRIGQADIARGVAPCFCLG